MSRIGIRQARNARVGALAVVSTAMRAGIGWFTSTCLRILCRAPSKAKWSASGKDDLLEAMSHDLRTSLQAILGWARILRQGSLNPAAMERGLEIIERNANVQVQLIKNVLDMSSILSDTLVLELEPHVNLADVIQTAVQSLHSVAAAKDVRIRTELPRVVPSVTGDARRLLQLLCNLVANAVKFTPRGGEVAVVMVARALEVEIQVVDTGRGIGGRVPAVFERFRRQDGVANRTQSGAELGLAIARHLVELHGGSIAASSPGEGRGATFTVILPTEPGALRASQAQAVSPGMTPLDGSGLPILAMDAPQQSRERVLVLDNETELCAMVARTLAGDGHVVRSAESISEAVRTASEFRPTLLIVDWTLDNGNNGADAVCAMRKVAPGLDAIVMSGDPPQRVRSRLGDLEVLDVVEKPFHAEELLQRIQRLRAGRASDEAGPPSARFKARPPS